MVFGTFDILHIGHIRLLKYAKNLTGQDGELIAVVARDSNVMKIKGHPPVFNEHERLEILSELKMVDKAILGDENDFTVPIKEWHPDIIVLGYDQSAKMTEELIKKAGIKCKVVVAPRFIELDVASSSEARRRLGEILLKELRINNQNLSMREK
ncbi:MAG: adenylyltransferase/cytidyltransferase family protein [Candidatus Korarchaeota archaeon]